MIGELIHETTMDSANTYANTYAKGTVITLRKGSVVRSTNPSKEEYVLTRSQKVKVHRHYPPISETSMYPSKPAEVHWAGTGGYWCWTDASNILH